MGIKRNEYTYNPRAGIEMAYRSTVVSGPGATGHAHHHQHLHHQHQHNSFAVNSLGLPVASHVHTRLAAPRMNPATSLTLTMLPSQSSIPTINHEVPPPLQHLRNSNCIVPNHHYARSESSQGPTPGYVTGASGALYQPPLRSTAPQPATSAHQPDLTKHSMGFGQQQLQQTRPAMNNYRTAHPQTHAPRQSTHHRTTMYTNTSGGGTVYSPIMNQSMSSMYTQHLVGVTPPFVPPRSPYYSQNNSTLQSIMQQPQHATGYYTQFQNPPAYCYTQGPLLERSPASSGPAPTPQFATLPLVAQNLGGTMPPSSTIPKRPRIHAVAIIHPDTGDEVVTSNTDENQTLSGESSERQTPHSEISRIAEEFKERVKDSVNEDLHNASHMNAISKFTNSISNSDDKQISNTVAEITEVLSVLTESKPEPSGTPVVSALSNSPEIFPKQSLSSLKQQIIAAENLQSEVSIVTKDICDEATREKDSGLHNLVRSVSVQEQNVNCETSTGVIDERGSNVANENNLNIPDCNKVENLFIEFNKKMSLSSKDSENKEINDINTVNLKNIAAESILMTQDILLKDEVITTSDQDESLISAKTEDISHQLEDQPLQQTITPSDSAYETGQILRDDMLANNIGTDVDTSHENTEKVENIMVETVVKKEEATRSLSDDIYDKSSLDLLTPLFAHKLLENYNVSKDETDKAVSSDHDKVVREKNEDNRAKTELEVGSLSKTAPTASTQKLRKYFYSEGQWSPTNPTGAKCYDRDFLMQLQDDPKSKLKPDNIISALLKTKMGSMESLHSFGSMQRPSNDSLLPMFLKTSSQRGGMMIRSEPKKTSLSGKTPMKSSSSGMGKQNVIHVSLSLREDVKLNESENAWKPGRFKLLNATEEEKKTQDLYKNVRAVLNKITPQKFQALLGQIKALNIDNQERLEGVIDLVFEKAIDEPNYSVAYASMCKELGLMQVPANNPGQEQLFVNFRSLIIKRCQERFQKTEEEESRILKEKDQMEAEDQVKLKFLEEESRKIRWKSVGNIRFIGELYKHNMLTTKIMNHCINTLVTDPDEQKLECLCKLLTTIGKELEKSTNLDNYFKLMRDMVDRKIYKSISSRVRFMLQDVIDLRARHWATKTNDVPRTMDEIQKEAEAEQRHIQIMNANPTSRKDDRGGSKRGNAGGRSGSTNSMDSDAWYTPKGRFSVDSSKFKNINSNVDNVKLGPSNMMQWNRGSGAKTTSLRSQPLIPITSSNMYGLLENMSNETIPPIRSDIFSTQKETTTDYHSKGSSMERPAFKSTSGPAPLASSGSGSGSGSLPAPEPMDIEKIKLRIGASLDEYFQFNDLKEITLDVKQRFHSSDHAVLIREIFNIAFEKPEKVHEKISNVLVHLVVTSKAVSKENFLAGLEEILNCTSDLLLDIPMIYEYVATLITPVILHQGLSLQQLFNASKSVLEANDRGRLLCCILNKIVANWGRNFTRSKWTSSGLLLKQWLAPDQVESFIKDNRFEFLEGEVDQIENADNTQPRLGPDLTQKKLLELMNTEHSADCIDAWIREHVIKDNQFIRAFAQAMCEHALSPTDGRSAWLDIERLSKYTPLLMKYCVQKEWHLQCLLAVQQLIHKLEHPQGVTLDLFQHFFDEHIISEQAFSEWEKTDLEPEGKAVMLKALVSFFTQIRECDDDNDDSCSED